MPHIEEGRLHAYLDGQLPARERSEIEAHLATCAECRARQEEAQRLVRESGALLERLDPGSPKALPWSEIEARGAARSQRPRRAVWLDPRFAWAASIALAFAVGWLTRGAQIPKELAQYEVRMAAADSAAARSERQLALDEAQPVAQSEDSKLSPGAAAGARRVERPAEIAKTEPAATPSDVPSTAGQLSEAPMAAGRNEARQPEVRLRAEAEARRRADEEARRREHAFAAPAAPPSAQQRLQLDTSPIMLDQIVVTGEVAELAAKTNELVGGAGFFRAPPELAETWLGAPVRTLPGHTLQKVEVGPGAAVRGGLSGRPVVRLIYGDTAGREITLLQQRNGMDDTTPALIVSPSGLRAYRWTDGEYVLTLAGLLSADSLRALADLVR